MNCHIEELIMHKQRAGSLKYYFLSLTVQLQVITYQNNMLLSKTNKYGNRTKTKLRER